MTHNVFVYGTLRPGKNERLFTVPGLMFDLGWFPGVTLDPDTPDARFIAEVVQVDDAGLSGFDSYEGYHEESPDSSLYLRKRITVDGVDGWIYVYNQGFDGYDRVTGDPACWLTHTEKQRGVNAGLTQG